MPILLRLSRAIDRINEAVGSVVAWLILLAVLVSAGNAVSRKALNMASNSWLELQWYLFSAVFLLCAAYTLKHGEHVRVEIIFAQVSRRTQHLVDLFGHIFFLMPFCLLMLWFLVPYVASSFATGEHSSNVGGLIIWPAKALLLGGFFLLALQGVSEIIRKAAILNGAIEDPDPPHLQKTPIDLERESGEQDR